jgi:hypothetical protein
MVTVEIVQCLLAVTRILFLRGRCGVILLGPGALYCLPVRHTGVWFIDKRVVHLAVSVMPIYMHFWYRTTDVIE